MSNVYGRMTCPVCRRQVSCSGGGVSHMRMHARANAPRAIEWFRSRDWLKEFEERHDSKRAFLKRHRAELKAMKAGKEG